mgnify:CR=1 FL=1
MSRNANESENASVIGNVIDYENAVLSVCRNENERRNEKPAFFAACRIFH